MLRRAATLLAAAAAIILVSNLVTAGQPSKPPIAGAGGALASASPIDELAAPGALPFAAAGGTASDQADADGRLPLADRLAFWSGRVERDPTDHVSMVQLATLEAQTARLTSDLSRYMRADAILDRALAIDGSSFPALRAKAGVRFALHDFTSAADLAERILAVAPEDAGALALHADAAVETGDLAEAAREYDHLASLVAGPAVDARRARLAYLRGDEVDAMRLAVAARDGARQAETGIDDPAFYRFQLAELARLTGDATLARSELKAGLALAPDDIRLLLCAARVDAATGRPTDAIAELRRLTAIVPTPESMGLLGDLLARTGDEVGAADAYATVDGIAQLAAGSGGAYDRQLALFALDHGRSDPGLVTRLRAALDVRHDTYGHDLLAWALYRAGEFEAADGEVDAALASGGHDARVIYHAGVIALATGDEAVGRARLQAALARSTALSPHEIDEASALLAARP